MTLGMAKKNSNLLTPQNLFINYLIKFIYLINGQMSVNSIRSN